MSNVNFDTYETVNYLAGMKILLGDEVLEFADGPVLSIAVEGDEADWSSLVLLITRAMEAAPVRLTSDEADHREVFDLMSWFSNARMQAATQIWESSSDSRFPDAVGPLEANFHISPVPATLYKKLV